MSAVTFTLVCVDTGVAAGIGDFGTHAMGVMRIEKGFRAWGSEMNCDTGPHEAGLGMFIRSDKVRSAPVTCDVPACC